VHDPKRILGHVCFNPEVWKAYEDVKSWGFTDIFRKHHPGVAGQYTFLIIELRIQSRGSLAGVLTTSWRQNRLRPNRRADSIDLESRLAEKPSDHLILYAQW